MKRITALRAVVAALLIGAVGLTGLAAAAAEKAPQSRPFHVIAEADFSTIGTCTGDAPLQRIVGSGQAAHLGRFEIQGLACLSSATNIITWIAANGDAITIEYRTEIGEIDQTGQAPIAFPATKVWGTGRFADVAVDGLFAGTVQFDPEGSSGHIVASLDGAITYDASNRSY